MSCRPVIAWRVTILNEVDGRKYAVTRELSLRCARALVTKGPPHEAASPRPEALAETCRGATAWPLLLAAARHQRCHGRQPTAAVGTGSLPARTLHVLAQHRAARAAATALLRHVQYRRPESGSGCLRSLADETRLPSPPALANVAALLGSWPAAQPPGRASGPPAATEASRGSARSTAQMPLRAQRHGARHAPRVPAAVSGD